MNLQYSFTEGRDVPLRLSGAGVQQQLLQTSNQQLAGLVKGRRGKWVLKSHTYKLLRKVPLET